MKTFCLLLLAVCASAANLAPKTYSKVCPAIGFSQDMVETNGQFIIQFRPDNPSLDFKFIDVHIVLETAEGQLVGVQRNYAMQPSNQQGVWMSEVKDSMHRDALRMMRPDVTLRYSFTYCVEVNGQPVDCDTETFTFERFEWRVGEFPACPVSCGQGTSATQRPVDCVLLNRDIVRPEHHCEGQLMPTSMRECPATEPCVTFERRESLMECPTECGLQTHTIPVPSQCIGSDGQTYPDEYCTDRLPQPIVCPATSPCVTFNWQPKQVQCPTECGLTQADIVPETLCVGSDGSVYGDEMCFNLLYPGAVRCPATQSCVTFYWDPMQVQCPTECGLMESDIAPKALCMGSDGSVYDHEMCFNLPYPGAVRCPATPSCITYSWRASLVECPTQCGLEATTIPTPATCVSSEGQVVSEEVCYQAQEMAPSATLCPATKLCPLSPYCHPIKYDHRVDRLGSSYKIVFSPYMEDQDIRRRSLDWVDVHVTIEDNNGNAMITQENHRMQRPNANDANFDFGWMVPAGKLQGYHGARLAYSFTYCVEMIDCDTRKYYFEL